jgi:parallel beta-helix repeat protein
MRISLAAFVICASIVFLVPVVSWAAVLHVPSEYITIQAGINAAVNGDIVLVADGIYNEGINFLGKAITVKSQNGPEYSTIQSPSVSIPTVRFGMGEGRSSIIQGFTISGSTAFCGINCIYTSPTIYGNIISNNEVGIEADNGGPLIRKNEITGAHHGSYGGAIYMQYGSYAIIDSNIIHDNYADAAAALFLKYSEHIIIQRNLVYSNQAIYIGGLDIDDCDAVTISNNTLVKNTSTGYIYGSITLVWRSGVQIFNNIISDNSEYGIYSYNAGNDAVINNNDIYSNLPENLSGFILGEGNINNDPQFVSLEFDNYNLQSISPCIDAGDPASPPDADWTIADIGAKAYLHSFNVYLPGDINGDDNRVGADVTYGIRYFKEIGNPPPDSVFNDSSSTWLYAAADVNGDCEFRGSDITFLVAFFKSVNPMLHWCKQTPPFSSR